MREQRVRLGRTFTRLCDREKFGMVIVRTALLSQISLQRRHGDCNEITASGRWKRHRDRPLVGDVRPKPEFMKMRLAEDERWPGGCRGTPKVRRRVAIKARRSGED